MNKAFLRESDDTEIRCPLCGAAGERVNDITLNTFVPPTLRSRLGGSVYFCPTPNCEAAYFDALEDCVRCNELEKTFYPKDPGAPICPCFGFTIDEIDLDLRERKPHRVKAHLARVAQSETNCETCSPNGRSCAAEIQRYFLRGWNGGGS